MDYANERQLSKDFIIQKLKFKPPLELFEWANKNIILNERTSSITGRWKTFQYQKEIMQAMIDPDVSKVVF